MDVDAKRGELHVFLDKYRLERGKNFVEDFSRALITSAVAVPVVSSAALKRMKGLDGNSEVDHVLLEWTLILELERSKRLSRCVPLMMGPEEDAASGALVGNLFQSKDKDALPDKVASKTVAEAQRILKEHAIEASAELEMRTVRQVVEKLLKFDGVQAWDVKAGHGVGAAGALAASSRAHCKSELVKACSTELVKVIRDAGPGRPFHGGVDQRAPVASPARTQTVSEDETVSAEVEQWLCDNKLVNLRGALRALGACGSVNHLLRLGEEEYLELERTHGVKRFHTKLLRDALARTAPSSSAVAAPASAVAAPASACCLVS